MDVFKRNNETHIVRPLRLFIYGCFILLGIHGGIQIFYNPQTIENQPPFSRQEDIFTGTTIVAFGDSVTAGYGISLDRAYPSILEELLIAQGYDVRVINSGVSGETSAGGLRRTDFVKSLNPDVVILALGGNDVLRGLQPEETKNNLREIIQSFRDDDIEVLLVGMYAPKNLGREYEITFDTLYPSLSQELNVPLTPFLLEGVALNQDLNQGDGIHPDETGARIIAEKNILPKIVQLLEK